jgi:acyl carrier protein
MRDWVDTLDNLDSETVFLQIKDIITDLLGADVVRIVGVSPTSRFLADLEMDSIQIAILADKVNTRYGDRCDFNKWLSKRPLLFLLQLTVNDVVNFIVKGK